MTFLFTVLMTVKGASKMKMVVTVTVVLEIHCPQNT